MRDTTVTIQRPGSSSSSVAAQHIRVQVDQASLNEVIQHQTAYNFTGADLFKVYTYDWNPDALIRRDDVLIDENATDPETGQPFQYTVTGRVKDFEWSHQECYARVPVGS